MQLAPPLLSRRTLLLNVALINLRAQTSSEHDIWSRYTDWARTQPAGSGSPDRYRSVLASSGLSGSEIERAMAVIQNHSPQSQRNRMNSFWEDAAAANGNQKFQTTPSVWLARCVEGVKPGTALDLGMGQGRNSLYLARLGWSVTGIDLSDVGVAQAQQQAAKLGIHYSTVVANLDTWDFGSDRWDLIASIFEPDTRWAQSIVTSLRLGGIFVRENFVFNQNENGVLKAFDRLRIVSYEDKLDNIDYDPDGRAPKEPQRVQRMVAKKIA